MSSSLSPTSNPDEPSNQYAAASAFPRFSALPPELRLQIWRAFAPIDLRRSPQVLAFELRLPAGRKQSVVQPCPSLANQTAAVRAVLAVNRESRTEACKTYKHTMDLCDGELVVRFDRDRDVVLVDTAEPGQSLAGWEHGVLGFTDEVRQLAVGPRYFNQFRLFNTHPGWLLRFLSPFGRLGVVYYTLTACVLDDADCAWCVSGEVHSFYRPETAGTTKRPYRPRPCTAGLTWSKAAVGNMPGKRSRFGRGNTQSRHPWTISCAWSRSRCRRTGRPSPSSSSRPLTRASRTSSCGGCRRWSIGPWWPFRASPASGGFGLWAVRAWKDIPTIRTRTRLGTRYDLYRLGLRVTGGSGKYCTECWCGLRRSDENVGWVSFLFDKVPMQSLTISNQLVGWNNSHSTIAPFFIIYIQLHFISIAAVQLCQLTLSHTCKPLIRRSFHDRPFRGTSINGVFQDSP